MCVCSLHRNFDTSYDPPVKFPCQQCWSSSHNWPQLLPAHHNVSSVFNSFNLISRSRRVTTERKSSASLPLFKWIFQHFSFLCYANPCHTFFFYFILFYHHQFSSVCCWYISMYLLPISVVRSSKKLLECWRSSRYLVSSSLVSYHFADGRPPSTTINLIHRVEPDSRTTDLSVADPLKRPLSWLRRPYLIPASRLKHSIRRFGNAPISHDRCKRSHPSSGRIRFGSANWDGWANRTASSTSCHNWRFTISIDCRIGWKLTVVRTS